MSRDEIAVMYYPEKLSVEEFIRAITKEHLNQSFITNMNNLAKEDSKLMPRHQYAEDWIQTYAAWMEMNHA